MSHEALTDYFSRINQQPSTVIADNVEKEASMFTKLKQYWQDKFAFVDNKPTVEPTEEGFWTFGMHTGAYYDSDDKVEIPEKSTFIHEETNGTWMEQLDKILDMMGEHYGYDIKSQVYYSVTFPLNIEGEAGYGRCLNDEVLQQLLLSYPEAYEVHPSMKFLMENK